MNTTHSIPVARRALSFCALGLAWLLTPAVAFAQTPAKAQEMKQPDLAKVLHSVESFSVKKSDQAVATFFVVNNGSGSAQTPGTDESSSAVLVSVSEYGEHPAPRLFSVGPFAGKVLLTSAPAGAGNAIMVEHGPVGHRVKSQVAFYKDRVTYN